MLEEKVMTVFSIVGMITTALIVIFLLVQFYRHLGNVRNKKAKKLYFMMYDFEKELMKLIENGGYQPHIRNKVREFGEKRRRVFLK